MLWRCRRGLMPSCFFQFCRHCQDMILDERRCQRCDFLREARLRLQRHLWDVHERRKDKLEVRKRDTVLIDSVHEEGFYLIPPGEPLFVVHCVLQRIDLLVLPMFIGFEDIVCGARKSALLCAIQPLDILDGPLVRMRPASDEEGAAETLRD